MDGHSGRAQIPPGRLRTLSRGALHTPASIIHALQRNELPRTIKRTQLGGIAKGIPDCAAQIHEHL